MKYIIYHAISPNNYEVEIMTDGKKGGPTYQELAQEEMRIMKMEAAGWKVKKAVDVPPTPIRPLAATMAPQVAQFKVGDTCPVHTQVMDKLTRTNKPYHTFNGQNCSGEGWWPKRE